MYYYVQSALTGGRCCRCSCCGHSAVAESAYGGRRVVAGAIVAGPRAVLALGVGNAPAGRRVEAEGGRGEDRQRWLHLLHLVARRPPVDGRHRRLVPVAGEAFALARRRARLAHGAEHRRVD